MDLPTKTIIKWQPLILDAISSSHSSSGSSLFDDQSCTTNGVGESLLAWPAKRIFDVSSWSKSKLKKDRGSAIHVRLPISLGSRLRRRCVSSNDCTSNACSKQG